MLVLWCTNPSPPRMFMYNLWHEFVYSVGKTYNLEIHENYFMLPSLPPDTEFTFQVSRCIKWMNLLKCTDILLSLHLVMQFIPFLNLWYIRNFFFEAKIPTLHSQINISCCISKLKLKHGLMCLLAQRAVMIVSNTQWERNGWTQEIALQWFGRRRERVQDGQSAMLTSC